MVNYDRKSLDHAIYILQKHHDLDKYGVEYSDIVLSSVEYHYNKSMVILIHEEDDDYQGDGIIIGVDEDVTFYYCMYGFGSCGGCDAIQSCSSNDDFAELVIETTCMPLKKEKVSQYLEKELKNHY